MSTLMDARALRNSIGAAQESVGRLDAAAAAQDLAAVQLEATRTRASTSGLAWRIAEHVPVFAGTARATTALAEVADDLAAAVEPMVKSLQGTTTTADKALAVLHEPESLAKLAVTVRAAAERMNGVSAGLLMFGLGGAVSEAQQALPAMADSLESMAKATGPMLSMLGADRPTTWLVMAQNPDEIRGSGGLFSAYLLVRFTDGKMEIVEAGSRKQLDREFPRTEQIPYFTATDIDTASTWGPSLGEWAVFNIAPDFPTVARLAAAGMAKRGTPVDGVIAIDPAITAAILAGTGSVEHAGVTIDASNAQEFFSKGLYEKYPGFADVQAKDQLAMGLTYATIDAAMKRPLDVSSLWSAMQAAIEGGHLKVWAKKPANQDWLMTLPVASAFAQQPNVPVVGFVNATGGKLDAYISRDVTIDTSRCPADKEIDLRVEMKNSAPTGLPGYVDVSLDQNGDPDPSVRPGYSKTLVTVYGPGSAAPGASYRTTATLEGKSVSPVYGSTAGRPNWMFTVPLQRGESATIATTLKVSTCP
ncbi:MAG: DUF4012 domain-containing protein [Candidatus Nanopelagicales bacterium]|nr:DUF4012 domain-containing protein [Candidatus Nanopelagicales bacterium]